MTRSLRIQKVKGTQNTIYVKCSGLALGPKGTCCDSRARCCLEQDVAQSTVLPRGVGCWGFGLSQGWPRSGQGLTPRAFRCYNPPSSQALGPQPSIRTLAKQLSRSLERPLGTVAIQGEQLSGSPDSLKRVSLSSRKFPMSIQIALILIDRRLVLNSCYDPKISPKH